MVYAIMCRAPAHFQFRSTTRIGDECNWAGTATRPSVTSPTKAWAKYGAILLAVASERGRDLRSLGVPSCPCSTLHDLGSPCWPARYGYFVALGPRSGHRINACCRPSAWIRWLGLLCVCRDRLDNRHGRLWHYNFSRVHWAESSGRSLCVRTCCDCVARPGPGTARSLPLLGWHAAFMQFEDPLTGAVRLNLGRIQLGHSSFGQVKRRAVHCEGYGPDCVPRENTLD